MATATKAENVTAFGANQVGRNFTSQFLKGKKGKEGLECSFEAQCLRAYQKGMRKGSVSDSLMPLYLYFVSISRSFALRRAIVSLMPPCASSNLSIIRIILAAECFAF